MSDIIRKMEATSKTHLNNIMQVAVFTLNDGVDYGINISKIRSFEDFKKFKIIGNDTVNSPLLDGYIQYQEQVIPVINVEKWLEIYQPENIYLEYVICEFNQKRVAFPISGIKNIFNVKIEDLQKPDLDTGVVTYNVILEIDGEEQVCMVLDVEQLLFDAFGKDYVIDEARQPVETDKELLVAEDSRIAREIIHDILDGLVRYRVFGDGQELIDYVSALDDEGIAGIGMIITDLEMPRKDGYQVVRFIKETAWTAHIPMGVNTSMSDKGVGVKTQGLGVEAFVAKTDPENFMAAVREYMLP